MTATESMKKAAALAALEFVKPGMIIGIGTGSTINYFIEALATIKHKVDAAVASSVATAKLLRGHGINVLELNEVPALPLYVDSTDEFNDFLSLLKGGGGALTGEKIIAGLATKFVCIADQNKQVKALGHFPLPIEVIPMARSFVARELVKLGGDPVYRQGFITDYGNIILDVHNLVIAQPIALEAKLNNIPGIVTNGLFAKRGADILLLASLDGTVKTLYSRARVSED